MSINYCCWGLWGRPGSVSPGDTHSLGFQGSCSVLMNYLYCEVTLQWILFLPLLMFSPCPCVLPSVPTPPGGRTRGRLPILFEQGRKGQSHSVNVRSHMYAVRTLNGTQGLESETEGGEGFRTKPVDGLAASKVCDCAVPSLWCGAGPMDCRAFSNLNRHKDYLGILVKWQLWFGRSRAEPENLHS